MFELQKEPGFANELPNDIPSRFVFLYDANTFS